MKKILLTLVITLLSVFNIIGQNSSIITLLEGKWQLEYSECQYYSFPNPTIVIDSSDNHIVTFDSLSIANVSYDYRRNNNSYLSGNSKIETIGFSGSIHYITDIDRIITSVNDSVLVLSSGLLIPDINCDYHYTKLQIPTSNENLNTDISINVYPNPSTGLLNISSIKHTGYVYIYSIDGGIFSTHNYNTGNTKINLSLSDGIYGVVLTDNSGKIIKTDKILIKK
jgi:hypothetical protein